jgi:Zn-finger nucleic acid-binding protein
MELLLQLTNRTGKGKRSLKIEWNCCKECEKVWTQQGENKLIIKRKTEWGLCGGKVAPRDRE